MIYGLQQVLNGAPVAAFYAALAFGYSLAFSLTKRADITFGALVACAGHLFLLVAHIGWNRLVLTFPAALGFGALVALLAVPAAGIALGGRVIAPLALRSPNAVMVAALGIMLVLMEAARLLSGTRELWLPPFLNSPAFIVSDGSVRMSLTMLQVINTLVLLLLIAVVALFLRRSAFGRNWQAVSQDPLAARLCGIDPAAIHAGAYGLAAVFAALCGLLATAHYGTMDFGAGLVFGLKTVLIAAVGGHHHPLRAAGGAALVGFAEALWSAYLPLAWRDAAVFGALIVLLVLRRRVPDDL
ncbi:branched-chain amino acid ABC transporter permease [Rhizobium sp. SSA_523]|uniref:branched-chain amino acid ABC transporter permease n=1 Tax=Rhizobium sp. SSA_523 TaxID=2952477 RepID=UPI0020901842|nr:branched-chain amino acid ABC transporter permease [Rhizobium sp. SSA_523]MCO5730746.1 branched-chain amino acid ABC transporter permease [Rhizobium sp. SSA_523]WKC24430.1 branched-chain amino acid ABC transporter permease [Rhizobium sp. SSA_523]